MPRADTGLPYFLGSRIWITRRCCFAFLSSGGTSATEGAGKRDRQEKEAMRLWATWMRGYGTACTCSLIPLHERFNGVMSERRERRRVHSCIPLGSPIMKNSHILSFQSSVHPFKQMICFEISHNRGGAQKCETLGTLTTFRASIHMQNLPQINPFPIGNFF